MWMGQCEEVWNYRCTERSYHSKIRQRDDLGLLDHVLLYQNRLWSQVRFRIPLLDYKGKYALA